MPARLSTAPVLPAIALHATHLKLDSNGDASGTAAITKYEVDRYSFVARRTGTYRLAALTPDSDLDTVLTVFNRLGQRVARNDDIDFPSNTDSEVFRRLVAGRRYYFAITSYERAGLGSYTWDIHYHGRFFAADDSFEDNDTFDDAASLGTLRSGRTLGGLVLRDRADWFRFTMTAPGEAGDFVRLDFVNAQGNLDLFLHDAAGDLIGGSLSQQDREEISLEGWAAGTYFVQVVGFEDAANFSYRLTVEPGTEAGALAGDHVLYLNFDGADLRRADLVRWAGTAWGGFLNDLDEDRNGITVQAFLSQRADREAIINQILNLVQADLAPFGIEVVRHFDVAVEGQRATTVFLGPATLTNRYFHVASEIDEGNDNLTDIAFVGEEDWGSAARTALALADVVLHEAGHTYGLYHVESGRVLETMGLRYSNANKEAWVNDSAFLDLAFLIRRGHGPNRLQNSYQVMVETFGLGTASA